MTEFGSKLRTAREAKGMTQQMLADRVYVTRQTVSRWESGDRYPDLLMLKTLSSVLEVSTDELLSAGSLSQIVEKTSVVERPLQNNLLIAFYTASVVLFVVHACLLIVQSGGLTGQLPTGGRGDAALLYQEFKDLLEAGLLFYGFLMLLKGSYPPKKTGIVMTGFFLLEMKVIGAVAAFSYFYKEVKVGIFAILIWLTSILSGCITFRNLLVVYHYDHSLVNVTSVMALFLRVIIFITFCYQTKVLSQRRKQAAEMEGGVASTTSDTVHFQKIAVLLLAIVLLISASLALLLKVVLPSRKYEQAVALMEVGDYSAARKKFDALNGYKDSAVRIEKCGEMLAPDRIAAAFSLSVGDSFSFGSYEQNRQKTDGKEDIEWMILAREENRMLVISKYALDQIPYDEYESDICWSDSSIRVWLNEDFLNDAFSQAEKAYIAPITLKAEPDPPGSVCRGQDTTDLLFLLSVAEYEQYFSKELSGACKATFYARANGAYRNEQNDTWWWLRSFGDTPGFAKSVDEYGQVSIGGHFIRGDDDAVRPAMWLKLK